jgi:hypothetical protein
LRTIENIKELCNITQYMSLLDRFDFDRAGPEIAAIQAVPERWLSDDKAVADKRKNRAQQQARAQQIQAMPAQAAMMKAQAVQAKAGVGPQQQQQPGVPA